MVGNLGIKLDGGYATIMSNYNKVGIDEGGARVEERARSGKQKRGGNSEMSNPNHTDRSTILHVPLQLSVARQAKPTGYQFPNILSRSPDHDPKVRFARCTDIQTT